MTVSRAELIRRAVRRLGGRTGSITSGTGTTAVLAGLVGTTGDNNAFVGASLLMPDAATDADVERVITGWVDATGTATFATRADSTYTDETYAIVNAQDYSLSELRLAAATAFRNTKRSYRQVVALTPNRRLQALDAMTWLEGDGDIDAVWMSHSPNMVANEDFALWPQPAPATQTAPDGWTLAGANATIARATTGLRSPYAATLTRVGADATLYQSVPPSLLQYLLRSVSAPLPVVHVGAWANSTTASIARVGIYNGTSTTWTSYHTGTGVPQWLTTSYQTTATDKDLRLVCSVDTTNGAGTFHATALAVGGMPDPLKDAGSLAYQQQSVNRVVRNIGSVPAVELASEPSQYGQLIVYARRAFATTTLDTDTVDDQYARCLEAGLVRFLVEAMKPNQDRTRLDRLMTEEARTWTRLANNFIDFPVPAIPAQYQIVGA